MNGSPAVVSPSMDRPMIPIMTPTRASSRFHACSSSFNCVSLVTHRKKLTTPTANNLPAMHVLPRPIGVTDSTQ